MQRKDRSKLWVFIGVIGLLLLALQGVSAQDQPVFHIGVLDDERGAISNGARLAVQEINSAGGIRGADGTMFQLDLVIEPSNSGLNLDQSTAELKTADVTAVIGPETTDEVLNATTALQSVGVPIITPATGDTIIMSDTTGMTFQSRAGDALQGQVLATYLINENKLKDIATVQLDVASTANVVDFTNGAQTLGVVPAPALLLQDPGDMDSIVAALVKANPEVVVTYGDPARAATLYTGLRSQAWLGLFAFDQAFDPAFHDSVPFNQPTGVISVTTWPFTATDPLSITFVQSFINTYGTLPGPIEASSYDSVKLIANELTQPGNLRDGLASAAPIIGVQGLLKAQDIGVGSLSNNVSIVRLGALGAPEILARYVGNQRLPSGLPVTPEVTLTPTPIPSPTLVPSPTPTSTPEGVVLTVKQPVQNVRTGPGDNYGLLGQLTQGEQAAVIGANVDYTWVVINFRGTQGWLATYLVDISGDLRTVPVIPAPPTPIPNFTATPTLAPATPPDLIIVSASISPNPIIANQTFNVNITIGNIGGTAAGPFVIAGTFQPNNVALVASVPGLGAGQSSSLTMAGVLNGSGSFTTSLQMDAQNQVNEGSIGEQNNTYNISYTIGGNVSILRQASQTLNLGDTLDLEGNGAQGDVNWNNDGGNLGLKAIFGSRLGNMGSGDFNAVTYDMISPNITTRDNIPRSEMNVGTLIGIVTADGHRGVMQVTAISDTQISLNFKVYNA